MKKPKLSHDQAGWVSKGRRVARNLALAWKKSRGGDPDELLSVAHEALVEAAVSFRPERQASFETFAFLRIRSRLATHQKQRVRDDRRMLMLPMPLEELLSYPDDRGDLFTDGPAENLGHLRSVLDEYATALALHHAGPESGSVDGSLGAALRRARDELGEPDKSILELRYDRGATCRATAEALGLSAASVCRSERRALSRLRARLTAEGRI